MPTLQPLTSRPIKPARAGPATIAANPATVEAPTANTRSLKAAGAIAESTAAVVEAARIGCKARDDHGGEGLGCNQQSCHDCVSLMEDYGHRRTRRDRCARSAETTSHCDLSSWRQATV
jgi:hypothetical protein